MFVSKVKQGARVTCRAYKDNPEGTIESDEVKTIRGQKYVWVRWDDADKLFYGKAIMEPLARLQGVLS